MRRPLSIADSVCLLIGWKGRCVKSNQLESTEGTEFTLQSLRTFLFNSPGRDYKVRRDSQGLGGMQEVGTVLSR